MTQAGTEATSARRLGSHVPQPRSQRQLLVAIYHQQRQAASTKHHPISDKRFGHPMQLPNTAKPRIQESGFGLLLRVHIPAACCLQTAGEC